MLHEVWLILTRLHVAEESLISRRLRKVIGMKRLNRLPVFMRAILLATFVAGCVVINAIAYTEIVDTLQTRSAVSTSPSTTVQNESALQPISDTVEPTAKPPANTESLTELPTNTAPPANTEPQFGHQPYAEATAAELALIGSYAEANRQREETLHPEAAAALFKMVAAARAEGIWLVPASGFRSLAQQRDLFNAQIIRKGTPEAAAVLSAPPGYSEHHTGYAVDLIDGSLPQSEDISETFADTLAYEWLLANADTYEFELSFPEDNDQGIAFEPWHWRYVGSPAAQRVFGVAPVTLDTRNATNDIIE